MRRADQFLRGQSCINVEKVRLGSIAPRPQLSHVRFALIATLFGTGTQLQTATGFSVLSPRRSPGSATGARGQAERRP
jgi:hypothetical protein